MLEKTPEIWGAGGVAIGGAMGTAVAAIVRWYLNRKDKDIDQSHEESEAIRKELREDLKRSEDYVLKVRIELDHWKDKYFDIAGKNAELRGELAVLKSELESLKPVKK